MKTLDSAVSPSSGIQNSSLSESCSTFSNWAASTWDYFQLSENQCGVKMDPAPMGTAGNPGKQNDTESELFHCKICSKAFTKRPSRNRHVLYCRKKLTANLPVVRKSCAACRKAKVKCNSEFPRCYRCVDKGLGCMYELTRRSENLALQPASPLRNEARSAADAMVPGTSQLDGRTDILWEPSSSCNNQALPNSTADQPRALTVTSERSYWNAVPEWELNDAVVEELQRSEFMASFSPNDSGNEFPFDWFSSDPLPGLTLESTISIPADCMFHTPYLVLRPVDFDYQDHSASVLAPRSPFIHSQLSSSSQIGRTFLLQNMQSYATFLASSRLPPIIHPVSLPHQGPSLPNCAPLEICKSIISLYANKTVATSPFIWRTIGMEKDRFMKEFNDADDWTTLSMLQAITLYILLRIFDQDSFSVDFDLELVHAMTKLAIKAEQRELLCSAEVEGRRPDWKEWLLLESKRRTVTLLFLLFLLFDIKPEQRAKSHAGLSVLPLPAHKQLWQADGEYEWRQVYDEMLRARAGSSYLRYDDLRDLGKGRVTGGRMKDLSEWMISVDAFGILVMMAATTL